MMVSKIAVVALVAIISVPILLGYAMNLTETTETDWHTTGEAVNVTQLLQNDTEYTYTNADLYKINTFNITNASVKNSLPLYEKRSYSSSPLYSRIFFNVGTPGVDYDLTNYHNIGVNVYSSTTSQYLRMKVYYVDSDNVEHSYATLNNVITFSYTDDSKTLRASYYPPGAPYMYGLTYTNDHIILRFEHVNGFVANDNAVMWGYPKSDVMGTYPGFVDLSAGYRLMNHTQSVFDPSGSTYPEPNNISFPQAAKNYLLTMDLGSIPNSSYSVIINGHFLLEKTTTDGVVSWNITNTYDPTNSFDLYYDQTGGKNTYQIYVYTEKNGTPVDGSPGYYNYVRHYEFRYIGDWPDLFGEATYYLNYDVQDVITGTDEPTMNTLTFSHTYTTPVMRMDNALLRAFETQVIKNQTYQPSTFKTNPATKITNITQYGSTLEFGGNNYTVTDGKITVGGHNVPVKDLIFSSVLNESNTYDNMIGNTIISTSASPSSIVFNGSWAASVSTESMEQYTYTKTEWHAGEFGWDGIDQNFLIVGLITCLGVFVALGIYARKRGTGGIIPLMIVTGCAAAVFFIML